MKMIVALSETVNILRFPTLNLLATDDTPISRTLH